MNRILLLAALLCCAAFSLFGQGGAASITGTITDASGAVVANAPIEVRNVDNGAISRTVTTDSGNYTVSQLGIGDYDLSVTVAGFKTYTHSKFHLASGQILREDIALEVGQTTDSVTITADASLLKTDSTQLLKTSHWRS